MVVGGGFCILVAFQDPAAAVKTLDLRRGTAQVRHAYEKGGSEITERQVGQQMQTVEPALRMRNATGLQKASNSPLHTLYNLHSTLSNRISNCSTTFTLFSR
jgi:hypothetical protein